MPPFPSFVYIPLVTISLSAFTNDLLIGWNLIIKYQSNHHLNVLIMSKITVGICLALVPNSMSHCRFPTVPSVTFKIPTKHVTTLH